MGQMQGERRAKEGRESPKQARVGCPEEKETKQETERTSEAKEQISDGLMRKNEKRRRAR